MDSFIDLLRTFGAEIIARPEGPFAFRFILQPLMSLLMATRDGIKDARTGRTPYLWHIASTDPQSRRAALLEGLKSTGRILLLGVLMIATEGDYRRANVAKNLVSSLNTLAAAVWFIANGAVSWRHTLVMGVGCLAGAFCGSHLARRIQQDAMRIVVIVQRESDLFQIVSALGTPRGFPSHLHGGQQQRDEQCDDGNDNQ